MVEVQIFEYQKYGRIQKIKTDSIAFDKCKFQTVILDQLAQFNPDIKKIQINSCDVSGELDFSNFKKLEELHLVYTIDDSQQLLKILETCKLKKLIISGDISADKVTKNLLGDLKKSGCSVEIKGPRI